MGTPSEKPSSQPSSGSSPTPINLPYEPVKQPLFTVGTLVYTTSGLVLLFVWLLWGDFALSMRDRSVGPLTEKFLLKYGANNTLKQVLTSTIPTVIALLISPIVSYKSDRMRSKWGRRIPFLMIPTPIAGLAMIGIAFCPQMGEWLYVAMGNTAPPGDAIHLAAANYTISIFTVLWIIFEVAVIISGSVMGGLINDVVPRPVLGRFFGLFRAISLFDGILFNALLFKHAEEHFTLMFALIGILFGGGFTLMCLTVKEGQYPPVPAEPNAGRGFPVGTAMDSSGALIPVAPPVPSFIEPIVNFFRAAMTYVRECFAQPYYLLMFAMFTFGALTFRPINDFTIRYAAQLKMPDADYGNLVAVSYLVSLTIAFPLGMFVDRFHALRMGILSLFLYLLTALYGSLFIDGPFTFGIALVAHTILSGTYFTCTASLGQQLFPRSKFSQYASAGGIVTSFAVLIAGPLMGLVLDKTDNNYRLTFWAGLILAAITLVLSVILYQRFQKLGGTQGYVAPGETEPPVSRNAPPARMLQNLGLYTVGAGIGMMVGYVLAFAVQIAKARAAGVGLGTFHTLIANDKDARGVTMVCLALCIIPGAMLGIWAASSKPTVAPARH